MESAAVPVPGGAIVVPDKGLKRNAIGYLSNLVISVASTAPGYSLAATLGFVVAVSGVGLQAPGVLMVSFVPMLFIASAYRYLNRADPDCGTTFSWVTRAMGPHLGWLGGWAIVAADIIVMATLAQIAAIYTYLLVGWDHGASTTAWILVGGVIWIILMTAICYIGIELSARTQQVLLTIELLTLAAFAITALVKVYTGHPAGAVKPEVSWFSPFAVDSWSALIDGVLLGVFIYWGWDSGVTVNEESEGSAEGPGRAAVVSTFVLLGIYVLVSAAAQSFHGEKFLIDNQDDVLSALGKDVFPSPFDKLLIIAVLTSASASTQTTILPTARTTLSMARKRAFPAAFGRVHARFKSPSVSTLAMGAASIVWFIAVLGFNSSGNVLGDSITGLGFAIAFYYGLTGFACVIYYRRELFKSVRNFVFVGVAPLLGALMLTGIFWKALIDYGRADAGYSPPIGKLQIPEVIGIGMLALGVVLMLFAMAKYRDFFRQRPEVAPAGLLERPIEHVPAHLFGEAHEHHEQG